MRAHRWRGRWRRSRNRGANITASGPGVVLERRSKGQGREAKEALPGRPREAEEARRAPARHRTDVHGTSGGLRLSSRRASSSPGDDWGNRTSTGAFRQRATQGSVILARLRQRWKPMQRYAGRIVSATQMGATVWALEQPERAHWQQLQRPNDSGPTRASSALYRRMMVPTVRPRVLHITAASRVPTRSQRASCTTETSSSASCVGTELMTGTSLRTLARLAQTRLRGRISSKLARLDGKRS
ncbi:hypothetical protein BD413DRAFT_41915 [Trametes elegans]|nr:hypothetical protein BD413DRAFT_41915 [Trametes elegans]